MIKISIIYYSKTGNTKNMAEVIAEGIRTYDNVDVKCFDVDNIDYEFLEDSKAVIFGTPTYCANTCWQLKKWFDESGKYNLEGKIGAVFATAIFDYGGGQTALLTMINHLVAKGMLVYSSGAGCGQPFIHLGPIAIKERLEESKPLFKIFGERIAKKSIELFSK